VAATPSVTMDTNNIIDHSLVIRAQAHDPDANQEIFEKMRPPIMGFIYRMLGPAYREHMEDIAQEVFLKVFRALQRFDVHRGVKFSTWVFTFTRNHCLDTLKKKKLPVFSLSAVDGDRPLSIRDEGALPPDQVAGGQEIGQRINPALRAINPEQRAVFEMRERKGMEYADIAKLMGVAEGTVKSRLHRARLALRELLSDLPGNLEPTTA
jgi:RNA polymerase sigma-70 factor (ECF subfamily)